jgi:hypothetical protein
MVVRQRPGQFERQPRLADTARPGQREQPDLGIAKQRLRGAYGLFAADQWRERNGKSAASALKLGHGCGIPGAEHGRGAWPIPAIMSYF